MLDPKRTQKEPVIVPDCKECRWWMVYSCKCVPDHCRRLAKPGESDCRFQPKRV